MIIVGLTGSIGMGKSTTASLFAQEGIPVNDADAVVHDLYRADAVAPVGKAFPGVIEDGIVNRQALAKQLAADPSGFETLEAIVHPLVRQRERQFLDTQRSRNAEIVVLDIPLLFESVRGDEMHSIVVVTCDARIQRQRVLARPNMTEEKFNLIVSRQIPDAEKRNRADFVVDTGHGLDAARERVRSIIADLRTGKMSENADA